MIIIFYSGVRISNHQKCEIEPSNTLREFYFFYRKEDTFSTSSTSTSTPGGNTSARSPSRGFLHHTGAPHVLKDDLLLYQLFPELQRLDPPGEPDAYSTVLQPLEVYPLLLQVLQVLEPLEPIDLRLQPTTSYPRTPGPAPPPPAPLPRSNASTSGSTAAYSSGTSSGTSSCYPPPAPGPLRIPTNHQPPYPSPRCHHPGPAPLRRFGTWWVTTGMYSTSLPALLAAA